MHDDEAQGEVEDFVRTAKTLLEQAEKSARNQRLVMKVGVELAASLDYETTLQKVARLVVAGFADWCFVNVVDPNGRIRDVAVAHADPKRETLARSLLENLPQLPSAPHGVSRVLRTLEPELHSGLGDAPSPLGHYLGADHPDSLRELGARSYICVPLVARGGPLGAITYVRGSNVAPYGEHDLDVARELARRSALAIDNAVLYRQTAEAVRERDELIATLSRELRALSSVLTTSLATSKLHGLDQATAKLKALLEDVLRVAPIDRAEAELDATDAARHDGLVPSKAPKTVFVADNDEAFRAELKEALLGRGYEVREAKDGGEALELLGRTAEGLPPDVVVLDVRMPGCSGLGVLSAMGQLPFLPPTVLVSGFKDPSIRLVGERLGAYRVLFKPVDASQLLALVDEAARKGPTARRTGRTVRS